LFWQYAPTVTKKIGVFVRFRAPLQPVFKVSLFNILQEGDIQIR
jgi:hypothetical protein